MGICRKCLDQEEAYFKSLQESFSLSLYAGKTSCAVYSTQMPFSLEKMLSRQSQGDCSRDQAIRYVQQS